MSTAEDLFSSLDTEAEPRLVELLLRDQRDLTPVERFSQRHEEVEGPPLQARYYDDLIPSGLPEKGQQYAFRVDLDLCSGCKACVVACHSLNGLDADETWRDVGLLVSPDVAFQETVTTTCHHCEDPGCMKGCPVKAYDKDPVTGIVRHLDDQCIGCHYCVMMCPYDVPKANPSRGIVRKCDMCTGRLSAGEAPACVQACPSQAISIEIVEQGRLIPDRLLPVSPGAMPDSSHTRPTTRYVTRKPLPGLLLPADSAEIFPAKNHPSLAIMLVLTQLSVGAFAVESFRPSADAGLRLAVLLLALLFGLAGQVAAVTHLGRPAYAFRAFLGWRTSWMSREVIAFAAFTGLALLATAAAGASFWPGSLPGLVAAGPLLLAATTAFGLIGILASSMIYAATGRGFWSPAPTMGRFLGSVLVLGPAAVLVMDLGWAALAPVTDSAFLPDTGGLIGATMLASTAKLAGEGLFLLRIRMGPTRLEAESELGRSVRLMGGALRRITAVRFGLGIVGGLALPALVLGLSGPKASPDMGLMAAGAATLGLLACIGAELLERRLFFSAVSPVSMPGQG